MFTVSSKILLRQATFTPSRDALPPGSVTRNTAELSFHQPQVVIFQRAHHLDGHAGQVLVGDGRPVALHHVDAFPGKGLDDGQVGLEGRRLLRLEDERVDATVELPGQHEADDGRLDVLLVVLVGVKRVP